MTESRPKGVVCHLVVQGGAEALDFYKEAFGAEEIARMPAEDGKRLMHAELKLDGSTIFVCDDFPEYCGGKSRHPGALGGSPVTMHRYVPDVDAAIKRATDAGAKVVMPAADMFWGDRYGLVQDPFGHSWSLATPLKGT
jgi:PhnB protein